MSKSFKKEILTKDRHFFNDAHPCPVNITGKGQRVYWLHSIYVVYDTASRELDRQETACDGEAIVESGLVVWFGNEAGKVKDWG